MKYAIVALVLVGAWFVFNPAMRFLYNLRFDVPGIEIGLSTAVAISVLFAGFVAYQKLGK